MGRKTRLFPLLFLLVAPVLLAAEEPEPAASSQRPHAFFLTAGPVLLVNTDSGSAPSPVMFSCGLGTSLFLTSPLTFQGRLSFFTNYYLWDAAADCARPAEIENRTALVLSAIADVCAVRTWWRGRDQLQAGAGIGALLRGAVLANGVSSGDSGSAEERTAGDDVKDIQSWLWSGARWLCPELVISYLHALPGVRTAAGVEARFYVPLGSLVSGDGMDAALASVALKVQF